MTDVILQAPDSIFGPFRGRKRIMLSRLFRLSAPTWGGDPAGPQKSKKINDLWWYVDRVLWYRSLVFVASNMLLQVLLETQG